MNRQAVWHIRFRRLCSLGISGAVMGVTFYAYAHICDNVWRQADKLIIKPETSNLVIKDKASFKIFLQSNMDRPIAGHVQLVGTSEAFDITVAPEEGRRIRPGQPYEYEVTLVRKPGVKSGDYTLSFSAVIGGRTLRSYTLHVSQDDESQPGQRPALSERNGPRVARPIVDGSLGDECWKKAVILRTRNRHADSHLEPVALVAADDAALYIATTSRLSAEAAPQAVLILIELPASGRRFKFRVTSDGVVSAAGMAGATEQAISLADANVQAAAKCWPKVWNAELAIPLSILRMEGSPAGQMLRVNVVRERSEWPEGIDLWQSAGQVEFPR